jgi:hypothetical protein
MKPKTDHVPLTFVCAGPTMATGGKMMQLVYELDANGKVDGPGSLFQLKPAVKRLQPGHVYVIPGTKGPQGALSLIFSEAKFTRQFEDREQVAEWQARCMADRRLAESKALEKRLGHSMTQLEADARRLRMTYQGLRLRDRVAFEIWLLSELRGM